MTDKELLELAAKAAGIEIDWRKTADPYTLKILEFSYGWDPLTNDGDALRLAVKLEIEPFYDSCWVCIRGVEFEHIAEDKHHDQYAATRRAIVRAAAEIGKEMK